MKKKPLEFLFNGMLNGKYSFEGFLNDDVRSEYISKYKNGRKIYFPSRKLKAYQRFVSSLILEYLPINDDVVYSYRKGFNVVNAVKPHSTSRYFYHSDLENFFESINGEHITATLSKGINMCPIEGVEGYIDRIIELVVADDHLPQGFVTSPVMSNACLVDFDNVLVEKCRGSSLIYTRYSDDIIISGGDKITCDLAREFIIDSIFQSNMPFLKVNNKKSRCLSIGGKVTLLGINILPNGHLTVSSDVRKKTEMMLHFYLADKDKFSDFVGGNYKHGLAMLSGYLNHINAVDNIYLEKLKKKYGSTVIDVFVHQSGEIR